MGQVRNGGGWAVELCEGLKTGKYKVVEEVNNCEEVLDTYEQRLKTRFRGMTTRMFG